MLKDLLKVILIHILIKNAQKIGKIADERDDSMDGIPAPLLVGGAFRIKEEDDSRFAKKTLKVEDDHYRPKRMHVRKIKKRKIAK